MSHYNNCFNCLSRNLNEINTHKHMWYFCRDCNNIRRIKKEQYPLQHFSNTVKSNFPRILDRIPKIRGLKNIFDICSQRTSHTDSYHYYIEQFLSDNFDPSKTKYHSEYANFLLEMEKKGIDFKGEKLLDICGEPGYFAKNATQNFMQVFSTAYHPDVAERMSQVLGIKTHAFDFQNDFIDKIFTGYKFDCITIRYAINFCTNIKDFARGLKKILSDKGILYLSFVSPSLGCCLRWQFDDYTYEILYNPETLLRIFVEEGYRIHFYENNIDPYYYLNGISSNVKSFYKYYEYKNKKNSFLELNQKHSVVILENK